MRPFAIVYQDMKSDLPLYRSLCMVPEAVWDYALDQVSWAPGRGDHAAGDGWRVGWLGTLVRRTRLGTGVLGGFTSETQPLNSSDPPPGDWDWCYGLFDEDGDLIAWLTCGYNSEPCEPTPQLRARGGSLAVSEACVDVGSSGGGGEGEGNEPPVEWYPEDHASLQDTTLIVCPPQGPTNDFTADYCSGRTLTPPEEQKLLQVAATVSTTTGSPHCDTIASAFTRMVMNGRVRLKPGNGGPNNIGFQSAAGDVKLAWEGGGHVAITEGWVTGTLSSQSLSNPDATYTAIVVTLQAIVAHEGQHAAENYGYLPHSVPLHLTVPAAGGGTTTNAFLMSETAACGNVNQY